MSAGLCAILYIGFASGAISSTTRRENSLFHSISAPFFVGQTVGIFFALSESTTPAAKGSSELTMAISIPCDTAKSATKFGFVIDQIVNAPFVLQTISHIEGFICPITAYTLLPCPISFARTLSLPPCPTMSVFISN